MVCFLQVIQPISRFYCIHELVLWHDERTLRHDGTNQANKWLSSNVKALGKEESLSCARKSGKGCIHAVKSILPGE